MLFEVRRVWGAVGAQEEPGIATGGRLHQSQAVGLALEHGQAVVMWAHAAQEQGVAVVQQVVCSDGGTQIRVASGHVISGFFRGDVFHHDFQAWEVTAQRDQMLLDEHGFSVKEVDVGRCDFAVHQQQHAFALHGFKHGVDLAQVGHARVAVGGGPCRVELAGHHAGGFGADNF